MGPPPPDPRPQIERNKPSSGENPALRHLFHPSPQESFRSPWRASTDRSTQTKWLDKALAERAAIPHRLVFYHVPGWPSHRDFKGRTETEVRETWAPLFEKHRIPIAFDHHDHTYKRTHPIRDGKVAADGGVVYMGDGAWGVSVRPVKKPADTCYLAKSQSVNHCIRHTITGTRAEHVVLGHGGKKIDRITSER